MSTTRPDSSLCAVAPSPQLRERLQDASTRARREAGLPGAGSAPLLREQRRLGFNDGLLRPPSAFPPGSPRQALRRAALDRGPLRGSVRVAVVLIDFPDKTFEVDTGRFQELFFSEGAMPTGSALEYFRDVTGGLVELTGEVLGPYTMPQPLSWYANGNFGIGNPTGEPRAHIMAQDAVKAADPHADLSPYDNDGDGYVDAFVVVHAGRGGEETGDSGDIWSHKWVLPEEYQADTTKVYAYLTIPEDAKLGVTAHELGHLLFGFPDLYDTDYTSGGIGSWCLMAGGSWNGGGDTPAHPSAWCKVQQGWVQVETVTTDVEASIPDVKSSRTVHRLWTGGQDSSEYFLLENRQRSGYDAELPGDGLLVWHVDEAQGDNTDENHYLVALLQADGSRDLEQDLNRGDGGDPFPGDNGVTVLSGTTQPSSQSYAGQDTGVVVADISAPGESMTAALSVSGTVPGEEPDKPDEGEPDVARLVAEVKELRERMEQLTSAVASAGTALSGAGGVTGAAGKRRRGAWSRR